MGRKRQVGSAAYWSFEHTASQTQTCSRSTPFRQGLPPAAWDILSVPQKMVPLALHSRDAAATGMLPSSFTLSLLLSITLF